MNKLVTLLPMALVVLCGCNSRYQSFYEAEKACSKWKEDGMKYIYKQKEREFTHRWDKPWTDEFSEKSYEDHTRYCRKEEETKQILGIENIAITKEVFEIGEKVPEDEYEVTARFNY